MLAVSSSNHRQRSGWNLVDGHAIPGSGLLLTTWQTPALGFRKQERQLTTGSTGGCLQSIAQRTRSGACSYWIGIPFRLIPKIKLLATVVAAFLQVGRPSYHSTNSVKALKDALYLQHTWIHRVTVLKHIHTIKTIYFTQRFSHYAMQKLPIHHYQYKYIENYTTFL